MSKREFVFWPIIEHRDRAVAHPPHQFLA